MINIWNNHSNNIQNLIIVFKKIIKHQHFLKPQANSRVGKLLVEYFRCLA